MHGKQRIDHFFATKIEFVTHLYHYGCEMASRTYPLWIYSQFKDISGLQVTEYVNKRNRKTLYAVPYLGHYNDQMTQMKSWYASDGTYLCSTYDEPSFKDGNNETYIEASVSLTINSRMSHQLPIRVIRVADLQP